MEQQLAKDVITITSAPKDVFNIVEEKDGKARWVRIGVAFVNRDGSLNALLDTFPTAGKIQIRDRRKSKPA